MGARTRRMAVGAVAAWTMGAVAAGCTDLFHTTSDIRSACSVDAATPGCAIVDGGADSGAVDFCAWSSATAQSVAARTCAWIGACLGPLGGNAFGACSVQARLAFDCATNPDHPVKGSLRDQWVCLASAQNCDAVRRCIAPAPAACTGPGASLECAEAGSDLRVACGGDAGELVEDCALWAQACVVGDGGAACGPGGPPLDCTMFKTNCGAPQATIHVCAADGGAQTGINCSVSGGQTCNSFPPGDGQWVACIPETPDAADAACDASPSIACAHGKAYSCPAGVPESVDCASLLSQPDACAEGTVAGGFDWTSGCSLAAPCPADSCAGSVLTSCARGAPFTFDCSSIGPGRCHLVATEESASARAACSPP